MSKTINPNERDYIAELSKENELIRKVLKDFSCELSTILERETSAVALNKKADLLKEKLDVGGGQRSLESVIEEIRMNEKIIERQRLELNRITIRTNQVSNRDYFHSLEVDIEKTRNELNLVQKALKNSADNNGKTRNQGDVSDGINETMIKMNELEVEIYQYEKKNQALEKKMKKFKRRSTISR